MIFYFLDTNKNTLLNLATLDISDMTSAQNKFLLQQATLSNANQTVVEPINWALILGKTAPKWTPRSVRAYLTTVTERLDAHFGFIMSGPDIGKIEVTRLNRVPGLAPIKVNLTYWRMDQLFPQKISLKWMENDSEILKNCRSSQSAKPTANIRLYIRERNSR